MVAFQAVAGTAFQVRDGRGPHSLVFGPNDKGDDLQSMAPGVFLGGGAHPVTVTYGQFASMLLEPLARLSLAGSLHKSFATHRCSDSSLDRLWSTALEILAGLSLPDQQIFGGQRGEFLAHLSGLRALATPAQLLRFEITDADLEPVTADSTCALSHRMVYALRHALRRMVYALRHALRRMCIRPTARPTATWYTPYGTPYGACVYALRHALRRMYIRPTARPTAHGGTP